MTVTILEDEPIDIPEFVARSEYAYAQPNGERTLAFCFNMSSHYWIGLVDSQVVCTWGLIPPTLMSDQAYLWLVTSEAVKDHKFVFVRHSQVQIRKMLDIYPLIVGHCNPDDPLAIRWVKWLGAKFQEPQGKKMPFRIRREEWQHSLSSH